MARDVEMRYLRKLVKDNICASCEKGFISGDGDYTICKKCGNRICGACYHMIYNVSDFCSKKCAGETGLKKYTCCPDCIPQNCKTCNGPRCSKCEKFCSGKYKCDTCQHVHCLKCLEEISTGLICKNCVVFSIDEADDCGCGTDEDCEHCY
jgi:hypothetical protein